MLPAAAFLAEVSVFELGIRLVLSLAIVLALMGGLVLLARNRGGGKLLSLGFGAAASPIRVLAREHLTKTTTVAVMQVGARTLLVGASEHGVTVLGEGDDLVDPEPDPRQDDGDATEGDRTSPIPLPDGSGSPRMTRLVEGLRERTVRRS